MGSRVSPREGGAREPISCPVLRRSRRPLSPPLPASSPLLRCAPAKKMWSTGQIREVMAKRQILASFAKEDARRFSNAEPSLSSFFAGCEGLDSFNASIARKNKDSEAPQHLRTSQAWVKRGEGVLLSDLERADSLLRQATPSAQDERAAAPSPLPQRSSPRLQRAPSQASMKTASPDAQRAHSHLEAARSSPGAKRPASVVSPAKASSPSASRAASVVSRVSRKADEGSQHASPRSRRGAASVVSAAHSRAEASSVEQEPRAAAAGGRAGSAVSLASRSRGEASPRAATRSKTPAASSTVGAESSLQSYTDLSALPEQDTEDSVVAWFREQALLLMSQESKMREEQYKRRKAALRSRYWEKMDRVRNAVTPSVVDY